MKLKNATEVHINQIIGDIAWRTLAIADLDNLEEKPIDRYARALIRQALAESFLAGAAWMMEQKKGNQ